MSDAVSEAPAATDPGTRADESEAFGVHVAKSPPLAWLTVAAALAAMTLNQVLLPALGPDAKQALLRPLERWGAFSTNLTAIAGVIALGFGLLAFVRFSQLFGLRQRLMLATLAGMFLASIALATLFERQRTTAEGVLFAIAAAQVLTGLLGTSAARGAGGLYRRALGFLFAAMAACVLMSQLLQVLSHTHLDAWMSQTQEVLQDLGEGCYLVLLMGLGPVLLPGGVDVRARLARIAGFFVLPIALAGLHMAERALQHDYALLLYHAQRVTLLLDSYPRAYAVPFSLVLASGVSGGLGADPGRRQAAAGAFLLLASGYAPFAPGRVLTSVLGTLLIARTIIASGQPESAPEPPGDRSG